MGIALVIPTISFSEKNLGNVTAAGGPLESIAIGGPDYVNNLSNKATYFAYYTPYDTGERGVVWSIESGASYASINSNTGELLVLQGASFSSVTIKATSTIDSSIYATKEIVVNRLVVMEYVGSKGGDGIPYVTTINPASSYQYDMVFMLEDATDLDVFGTRISNTSNVLRFFGDENTNTFKVQKRQSGSAGNYELAPSIQTGIKYRVVITKDSSNGIRLYRIDGNTETLLAQAGDMSASISSSVPVMLGAFNNNGTPVAYKNAKLRIYGFRVFTSTENVLVLKPYFDEQNSRPALIDELTDTVYPYSSTGTATLYYKNSDESEQSVSINS